MTVPVIEIILVFVALLVYKIYNNCKKNGLHPPGPKPLPIIGNLHQIRQPFELFLSKMHKKYGKIIRIRLAHENCVVISDPKLIKELYNDISSAGRGRNPIFLQVSEGPYGLVNTVGEPWEAQRRFVIRKLRDFGFGRTSMEGMILEEVGRFNNWLETQGQNPVSCYRLFNTLVVNSLWYIVTGERNEWDGNSSGEKSELCRVADSFIPAITRCVTNGLVFVPFIRHVLPQLSGWNDLKNAIRGINGQCEKAIEAHKRNFDPSCPKDFIDEYLKEMNNTTDPKSSFYGKLGEKNLVANLADLFEGGSETSSTYLSWAMLFLSHYQNVQKKLQQELDKVVGNDRMPSLSDKPNLPYAEAVLQELLRRITLIPVGVPHEMIADKMFHGYLIPKGTTVMGNFYECSHDPEIWGDPEVFRPERFLSADEPLKVIRNHEAVLPFSTGRRVCIGESLARDTLFLVITSICQKFEIHPENSEKAPDFEPAPGSMCIPKPFSIVAKKRKA